MREILFRGYSKKKVWVYGNLLENDRPQEGSIYQIVNKTTESRFDVEEDSIGQYTGYEDKKGKKMFEGDIIISQIGDYIIRFDKGYWTAEDRDISVKLFLFAMRDVEVISNTYEEKLKEDK